jgi:hypothetical protein
MTASLLSTLLTLGALEIVARYWSDPTEGNADIVALGADARRSFTSAVPTTGATTFASGTSRLR